MIVPDRVRPGDLVPEREEAADAKPRAAARDRKNLVSGYSRASLESVSSRE